MLLRLSFQILTQALVSTSPLLEHTHPRSVSKTHMLTPLCPLRKWSNVRAGNLRGALVTFLLLR